MENSKTFPHAKFPKPYNILHFKNNFLTCKYIPKMAFINKKILNLHLLNKISIKLDFFLNFVYNTHKR